MLQATRQAHRAQSRLVLATLAATRRTWDQIGDDFDADWRKVGPRLVALTAAAQLGAARNGAAFVPAALDEQGIDVDPDGQVNPRGFAGYASDGRPLESLLYTAVVRSKVAMKARWGHDDRGATTYAPGLRVDEALKSGQSWLDTVVHTQISDAFRQAESVSVTTRPRIGHVRMVNAPCCQRCAVLAGRVYRWSTGFQRHPRCDCFMVPTTIANPSAPGVVIGPDDIKDLTKSQRKAIDDGADVNQVINSHRAGARGKGGMTTTAGKRKGSGQRLTPEGIYKVSATREEAVERLRQHGYLI